MTQNTNNLAAYIWTLADLLRGDFRQSQYGRIILPFTLLRRLECVLEPTKPAVLVAYEKVIAMNVPEEAQEKLLLRATGGLSFFNISKMDLAKLGEAGIAANLESYIQGFSKDAREIFEHFKFREFIGELNDANLLYKIVQKVRQTDLSPAVVSNHEMGLVFEELIRRFAESSNDTAGEHFTPRDIVRLTTSLVFMEDDDALTKPGIIRTIYDPTAGTGGFLSAGMEYVHELNLQAVMRGYGQELNPESYAICKADMLIKGQDVSNIKLGNTLSNDQLYADKFDYMLSNPPFGVDWKKIEQTIKDEHTQKGFAGRFGPGLPRVSDGSLLFLLHLISKLRDSANGGARIGIILNGSPLFTGSAGSGESEIRRYILEADLLEAIVALPTDMFYNTGIATYVWILSNKKAAERKGKVQLINGVNLCSKMRKSLGSKRNVMEENDIATITRAFGAFAVVEARELADVSNPDLIFDLFDKLRAAGIFTWSEVEQFCSAFFTKNKSNAAIANICKPAVERWQKRYQSAVEAYKLAKEMFERTKKTRDAVLIANAENSFKECKKEKDALDIFKKDLGTFVRFYEFMSQIVDYDDKSLEKLSLYARHLRPMLRETLMEEDNVDLSSVLLSHYRLSKIRQQDLKLQQDTGEYQLKPGEGLGTASAKDKQEEFLSQIISRLNELFITDHLTEKDLVNYAYTIRDKVSENALVMKQIANNSPEQAMLGDFTKAVDDAVMDSSEAHQNQMMQLLSDPAKAAGFAKVVFDLLKLAK